MTGFADKELVRVRKELNALWPDWAADAVLLEKDPPHAELIGYDQAKIRDLFKTLDSMKTIIKDARKNLIEELQAHCSHPKIALEPGKKDSKYSWEVKDKYVCEMCGKVDYEHNDTFDHVLSKDVRKLDRRSRQYLLVKNLESEQL